jgi:hypothetical protein
MNSLSKDHLKRYLSFKQIGCHSLTLTTIISIDEDKGALLIGLGASFFRKGTQVVHTFILVSFVSHRKLSEDTLFALRLHQKT